MENFWSFETRLDALLPLHGRFSLYRDRSRTAMGSIAIADTHDLSRTGCSNSIFRERMSNSMVMTIAAIHIPFSDSYTIANPLP